MCLKTHHISPHQVIINFHFPSSWESKHHYASASSVLLSLFIIMHQISFCDLQLHSLTPLLTAKCSSVRALLTSLSRRYASTTAFLMNDVSCFNLNFTMKDMMACCGPRPASSTCPFNTVGTSQSMCCEKVRLRVQLEAKPERYPWNSTAVAIPAWRLPVRDPDCKVVPHVPGMTLKVWLAQLLEHATRSCRCIHGLANKLQQAEDFIEVVHFLADRLQQRCPGRRTLLALRRNLMLWWDQRHVFDSWAQVKLVFRRALLALHKCQQKLTVTPVIQLHIPKTAGSAMTKWANMTGDLDQFHSYYRYRYLRCV